MFDRYKIQIEEQINPILKQEGLENSTLQWSLIPFSGHWGISTSFFQIAAQETRSGKKGNVAHRAAELAEMIASKLDIGTEFEKCEAVKGYLNIYFASKSFSQMVVEKVLEEKQLYGSHPPIDETVMVEFSQPNTHKAFHVGHLRNIVLGASVSNILEFNGNTVIRANYLGDIGLHVITWLWNYENFHEGETPPAENAISWIGELYAEAVKRREESEENEEAIRRYFQAWDNHDPEIIALWKETRQWSLDAFERLYEILGIHFDRLYFESEVEHVGKAFVEELIEKGLAKDERPGGAVIIDLDALLGTKEEYRVLVLLRSDGTSLYATKDIPLAVKKFEEYKLDRSIYVVDVRQSLYLKQIFKVLELLGYEWAKQCQHLAYEIVNLPGNVTLASREGTVVLLEDLIREAEKRAMEIVDKKNPELGLEDKQQIARMIALGSIKYSLLSRDNTKIVTFDWETALDVNGQAAPYIQYAAVRANSILRKVQYQIPSGWSNPSDLEEKEIVLVDLISRFPQEVEKAGRDLKPLVIANYAYDLAKAFNDFYTHCPVLSAKDEVRTFRLRLVAATKQTIINSLGLLGIQVPEIM
ncbi:MAG TPA: arginine--tRNA ligase [Anaerolineaceae bacterium]|uniref:Arginine--tRNA ligase n=1 Tax=Anaerolinea thermophila TaxID=167964 RepID=A0A101FZ93_9CHLR|nr:MAG: Arginine--tRNA ligase [Anaerolinea thermophila]HAF62813.1 arginine--tRNA ligase [Anaerolineaceae bacterium]